MPLRVGSFILGGLDERAGGGAIFGATKVAFDNGSGVRAGSCVLMRLPLFSFGAKSACGSNEAEGGPP